MKRFIVIAALALALSACGTTSILSGGTSLTATISNPIDINKLYAAEATYGATLAAVNIYKNQPLCKTGQTATLSNPCASRSLIVKLQAANAKVHAADLGARKFVKDNPTLSAVSVIDSVITAVNDFKAVATSNGLTVN